MGRQGWPFPSLAMGRHAPDTVPACYEPSANMFRTWSQTCYEPNADLFSRQFFQQFLRPNVSDNFLANFSGQFSGEFAGQIFWPNFPAKFSG